MPVPVTLAVTAPAPASAPMPAVEGRQARPRPAAAPLAAADRRELDALVAEHLPGLRAYARALCRAHLDPDDLIQIALERAFRALDKLRDRDRPRSWLLSIVHNTFIDEIRRQRARPQTVPIDPDKAHDACEGATEPMPWEHVSTEMLHAAVDKLPDDLRATYRMFALEGKDYVAIAAALDIPKSTVGTRLVRARKKLRALLAAGVEEDL